MPDCNTRYLGDGLSLLQGLPSHSITTSFLDPQYSAGLDKLSYGNEGVRQQGRALLPKMSEETIRSFVQEIDRVLIPSGHLFLWVDKYMVAEALFQGYIADTTLSVVDLITWDKVIIGMGYRTRRRCEYLLVLQKTPKRAKGCWTDHGIPDVWAEKVAREKAFPHRKPSGLIERLILATTTEGDSVLDPASGSFTVLSVCQKTNRSFLGCDLTTGDVPLPVDDTPKKPTSGPV